IQATQRFTHGFQFLAAYTFSKAKDDRPDQTTVVVGADDTKIVENQINPAADYARSDTDLRHRFVFSPVYEIGRIKWSDNAVARAIFSDYTLFNLATINNPPTPPFTGLALPSALTAFGTPRTFSSPASGTTTFATPRQLQLAVKFDF